MASKPPWFKFYSSDWEGDETVQMMTYAQRGMYLALLVRQHIEGSIPGDAGKICRLLKVDANPDFVKFWEACGGKFEMGDDGRLRNPKMAEVVKEYEGKRSQARSAALKRWSESNRNTDITQPHSARNADAMRTHCDPDPDPDPDLDKDTDKKKEKKAAPKKAQPRLVHWDPKPRWKKDDPSHKDAVLRVDPGHLRSLASDFPRVEGNGGGVQAEVLKMKRHALENPSWACRKRNWGKTLSNWLKRADERFDDTRFRANWMPQPADKIIAQEAEWEAGRSDNAAAIAKCEKENGPHITAKLTKGSKTLYCGCGYYELRKDDD